MTPAFRSGLFTLRPFRRGDEESLRRSIGSRKIYRCTLRIPYPYTPKRAREWISHNLRLSEKRKNQNSILPSMSKERLREG